MARMVPAPQGMSRVPIWIWGRTAPEGAVAQLERLAAQPYVMGHVAAMLYLHVAHGIAVGSVFATDAVVVPSALGGDLGCGVSAVRFDLPARALSRPDLQRILSGWAARIPVGAWEGHGCPRGAPCRSTLDEVPSITPASAWPGGSSAHLEVATTSSSSIAT